MKRLFTLLFLLLLPVVAAAQNFLFPSSPAINQQVTGPNGQVYKWDGVKWVAAPAAAALPAANPTYTGTMTGPNLNLTGALTFSGNAVGGACPANQYMTVLSGTLIPTCAPVTSVGAPLHNPTGGQNNYAPITGVTDGSNAAAGQVGEYVTTYNEVAGIAPGTNQFVTIIPAYTLSAGDWDVWGSGGIALLPGSAFTFLTVNIMVNGGLPSDAHANGFFTIGPGAVPAASDGSGNLALAPIRVSLSASGTIGLRAYLTNSGVEGVDLTGQLSARRVR